MLKQAPSVMEIGSALQNKEVTEARSTLSPIQQQVKPVVDIGQFREAYNKATNDGYKGKKSDFALKLESEGVQVEGFESYKEQMVKNEVIKGKRKSYFGMVTDVIDRRYQNTKKQFARTKGMVEDYDVTRNTPLGERIDKNIDVLKNWTATVGTPIGEGIASLTDIALNTLGRGIKAITPDSVERYVTKQGKEVWETVKDKEFVKDALGYLSNSVEDYNDRAISNPDEAQILANVMNITDVALIGGGAKVTKEVVEGASKKTLRMATVDEAKQIVQKKFKAVSDYVKTPKVGEVQDDLIDTFASKVGGLRQETIQTIRTNPLYEVAEKGELTRVGFGQEVLSAIEARREEISELGSLYNNFRNPNIIVDIIPVRKNVKTNILDKYNIKITKEGYDFRDSGFANDAADQNAIKNALDLLTEDSLTADVALNRRKAISKMSRFGSDVSGDGASVVREIRHQFNEQMHKDIKGLKAIDNQIAPEIQQIDSLVKDYYNKDGSLKDSFYSTITNITNKGKELKYDRLNKIIPDIDSRVSALKALEDVENALNHKTGIYDKISFMQSAFFGGFVVGGPIGGLVSGIFASKFSDPRKIVEVLKKRGGSALVVAEKLEANKALSAFDNEIIEKALRESGEQAQDITTRGERRLPVLVDDSIEQVDNLTPQATQQLDNVASPTATLDEMLKNATDEELKANGFTATMIKQRRKKNPLNKVGTTESATQSIAGKADEVLKPKAPMSKVDDALPVGEKMGNTVGLDKDFLENKIYGKQGQDWEQVGTLDDILTDKKLRNDFSDVLSTRVFKTTDAIEGKTGKKDAVAYFDRDKNLIAINVDKLSKQKSLGSEAILEEALHAKRFSKGRGFDNELPYLERKHEQTAKKGVAHYLGKNVDAKNKMDVTSIDGNKRLNFDSYFLSKSKEGMTKVEAIKKWNKAQTNQPTTLAPLVKSEGLPQIAKSLDSADLTSSIKKAKAEGKTFDEFVKGNTYYRGETGGGGNYYSTDFDFARDFTPSGLDSEVAKKVISPNDIFKSKDLPFAGNVEDIDKTIAQAKKQGKKAIFVSEGNGQPNSVFVFDKTTLSDSKAQLRQMRDQTPTPANGKTLPKVDNTLLSEARKYKSADEFEKVLQKEGKVIGEGNSGRVYEMGGYVYKNDTANEGKILDIMRGSDNIVGGETVNGKVKLQKAKRVLSIDDVKDEFNRYSMGETYIDNNAFGKLNRGVSEISNNLIHYGDQMQVGVFDDGLKILDFSISRKTADNTFSYNNLYDNLDALGKRYSDFGVGGYKDILNDGKSISRMFNSFAKKGSIDDIMKGDYAEQLGKQGYEAVEKAFNEGFDGDYIYYARDARPVMIEGTYKIPTKNRSMLLSKNKLTDSQIKNWELQPIIEIERKTESQLRKIREEANKTK